MKYTVLTLFPEITDAYFASSIMAKAIARGIIQYRSINIRDFAADKHKTCDDAPYGGGPGMLMLSEPLALAIKAAGGVSRLDNATEGVSHRLSEAAGGGNRHAGECDGVGGSRADEGARRMGVAEKPGAAAEPGRGLWSVGGRDESVPVSEKTSGNTPPRVIYLSPSGRPFDQALARDLAAEDELILVCGRYEGIDQRIIDLYIDDEISVGDYVLSSGEVAALAMIDATYRLVDEVITAESLDEESFSGGLLEYPQYTRPEIYDSIRVPEVLLSGHHENIRKWRLEKRVEKTLRTRPELIRRGRELGLFDKEINSIIDRQVLAEGDTEDERD